MDRRIYDYLIDYGYTEQELRDHEDIIKDSLLYHRLNLSIAMKDALHEIKKAIIKR